VITLSHDSLAVTTRRRDILFRQAPAFLTSVAGLRAQTNTRPNILFAIADDMSWPGAFPIRTGSNALRTPALDRVAKEGLRFDQSYCAAPSCTPSRSAVLTGRQLWQVEEGGVLYGTLRPKYPVFPHLLEDQGYHVGSTGKTWGPGNWKATGHTRPPAGREYNARLMRPAPAPGIDTRDYAANFDDFLAARKAGGQPFCFWFGCTEPHRVYENGIGKRMGKRVDDATPPPFWPDTELIRSDLLDYCAEVEWFDSHLGRMLASLERIGELDNTLVVVTSDNGMPFPRAKVNLYDWGVRMPLSMRWGRKLTPGVRTDLVHHTDFAPTFLEAAGIAPPQGIAGRNLLSKPGSPREFVCSGLERHTMCRPENASTYPVRSLRTERYLYLRNFKPDRWPTGGEHLSSNRTTHGDVDACPTKDYLVATAAKHPREFELNFGRRPAEELYDTQSDPYQMKNLAQDPAHQSIKKDLWTKLQTYLRQTGDPRIAGRDPWQDYVYHQTIGYGASFNKSLPADVRAKARGAGTHKPE